MITSGKYICVQLPIYSPVFLHREEKNKKLVFGCGGQVSLFVSINPSNHR